ncbi:FkbM family methyltransferase [Candidatus Thioglobus sp.]|nr:FkbM family methyltransferase [Candidatus Thioglobus sp.]
MNDLLKLILHKKIINFLIMIRSLLFDKDYVKSYAQNSEDLILKSFFYNLSCGFYVDVGAHHPKRFSNTYLFYKKGWSGINIDAKPGSMRIFNKLRPRDTNIEAGISDTKGKLCYYMFNEPAFNGFSKMLSNKVIKDERFFIESTTDIPMVTLEEVLDQNVGNNQQIDFLSIDVEGLDFKVLKSNNFLKYQPTVICIEIQSLSVEEILSDEISIFLKKFDYSICAKVFNSVFFIKKDFYNSLIKIV